MSKKKQQFKMSKSHSVMISKSNKKSPIPKQTTVEAARKTPLQNNKLAKAKQSAQNTGQLKMTLKNDLRED